MSPIKTEKEKKLFETYKKWLTYDSKIPLHIIENYKLDLKALKNENSNRQ